MHWIDASILLVYLVVLIGVGVWCMRRNNTVEDFFVGGRSMGAWHIGLSVVATDVGGGFSIGLGGLGFVMGLSGSWMLFTGLLGAWLAAVLLIPRVYAKARAHRLLTFPQLLGLYFDRRVAFLAAVICVIGYLGFTSSQLLAGAKLTAASVDGLDLRSALLVMGVVAVAYTVLGGMKAVVYTDTFQWIVLLAGFVLVALPMAWTAVGGWAAVRDTVDPAMLRLDNISAVRLINWAVAIMPIWFVGMTLYQRIYASRSEADARKAWYIAGVFEWPVMAFIGVTLGLLAHVAAQQGMLVMPDGGALTDPEMGLPLLMRAILPVGLLGVMLAVYFSVILSTADSCLMAASGNLLTDIVGRFRTIRDERAALRASQAFTLVLGAVAIALASVMENVLSLMLYSYAFMVSGLLVPLVAAVFFGVRDARAALWAMVAGGGLTVGLTLAGVALPFGLDANIFGILAATACILLLNRPALNGPLQQTA